MPRCGRVGRRAGLCDHDRPPRCETRSIDDAVFAEDKEVLEDLLAAAVNDAVRKVEAHNRDAMSGLASGLNLPAGFKMPF